MTEEWRRVSLGDATISEDSKRRPVKSSERVVGPYPYWGASGVVDHVSDFIFDFPALLVSEDGENLRTRKTPIAFYVSGRYWVNNHAHVLRAGPGFDLRFLAYAVGQCDVSGYITGSTQPKLTAGNLAKLQFLCPPLPEQRRIAEILGVLDELIGVNRTIASNCEALAQHLVAAAGSYCVLSELATWGGLATTAPSGPVHHYSLPAFDAGRCAERVEGAAIKSGKQVLRSDCVLVARLNPHIPRVWMVYPDAAASSVASTEFVPLFGSRVPTEVVYAICSSHGYLEQMNGLVTGTTGSHQRVDKEALVTVTVPDARLLPLERQEAIVHLVCEANASRATIAGLVAARDELLPLLLSGRLSVRGVAA